MLDPVELAEVLDRCGGVATRAALIHATSRAEVDRAQRHGHLRLVGHGRYVTPAVDEAAAAAHGVSGVLCLTSAALHHGWEVKETPKQPHVLVPRKRNIAHHRRARVRVHFADLGPDDAPDGIATSRELTLLQCLRQLPEDEALAIADSALRHGELTTLRRVAANVRGAGSSRVRRLASAARAESANPFESVTRSIALRVEGLRVEPQVVISSPNVWARPDLVDRELRLVIECESHEWHSNRDSLRKDVRRYTRLVIDGWTVVRFIWEDVMFRAEWVERMLVHAAALAAQRIELPHLPDHQGQPSHAA